MHGVESADRSSPLNAIQSLLARLSGGSAKALLPDYGDECFVHAGKYGALSPEQRRENLAAFLASIDRRIARLQAFAAALDTELPTPDGDRSKVEAISQVLDRFCKHKLSGLKLVEPALAGDWRAREPQGIERQVQTLAIDLGAYYGEVAIRCAPKYQWIVDDKRYTPATIMGTAGRVVIGHNPAVVARVMVNPVDAVAIAGFELSQIVHYRTLKAKQLWKLNHFHGLAAVADGQHS